MVSGRGVKESKGVHMYETDKNKKLKYVRTTCLSIGKWPGRHIHFCSKKRENLIT